MERRIPWAAIFLLAISTSRASGQCSGFPWTITASSPGGQSVAVRLCGIWVGCLPHNPQFTVAGDQIQITLTAGELPGCQCIVVDNYVNQTVLVSPVTPGNYTVTAIVVNCGQPQVVGTGDITVASVRAIPALDARGVATLALLIGIIGIWKLRV